uniref:HAT C-terminal dimerisation domain-containing protein n=1 Tax=Latimeria chalumnae TaxID=7897 RepID=H3A5U7_LATCH
ERAKALNSSIVNIILKDLHPISIVEGKGFREFVELVEPGYQLPSRTFFTQMVEKKYLVTMQHIKAELKTSEKIALISDTWTSLATEAYMSVTARFITDWQLKSINLATKPLSERHTGENIVTFTEQVLENFELEPSCIYALVCDNGANMVAAARKLKEKYSWASIRCAGHTIQLVVNSALKVTTINRAVGAARCLVEHFYISEAASSALKTKQQQMAVPQHSLKQDVSTQWNSTLHMVTRLLEQRWLVIAVLSDLTMTAKSNQWSLLEEVKQLLEPFEVAPTYISGEKYVSLSTVPSLINALRKEMQPDAEDSPSTVNFKTVALEQMNNRWKFQNNHHHPSTASTENAIVVAVALDPRFWKLTFLNKNSTSATLSNTLSRMEVTESGQPKPTHKNAGSGTGSGKSSGEEERPVSAAIKQAVIDKMFSFEESSSEDSDEEQLSCVQKEAMQNFSEKPSSRDIDPLAWWKTNQERFPHLSKLARTFLPLPATSIPSERLFSVAGTIASRKWAILTPQHVDILVFLHSN